METTASTGHDGIPLFFSCKHISWKAATSERLKLLAMFSAFGSFAEKETRSRLQNALEEHLRLAEEQKARELAQVLAWQDTSAAKDATSFRGHVEVRIRRMEYEDAFFCKNMREQFGYLEANHDATNFEVNDDHLALLLHKADLAALCQPQYSHPEIWNGEWARAEKDFKEYRVHIWNARVQMIRSQQEGRAQWAREGDEGLTHVTPEGYFHRICSRLPNDGAQLQSIMEYIAQQGAYEQARIEEYRQSRREKLRRRLLDEVRKNAELRAEERERQVAARLFRFQAQERARKAFDAQRQAQERARQHAWKEARERAHIQSMRATVGNQHLEAFKTWLDQCDKLLGKGDRSLISALTSFPEPPAWKCNNISCHSGASTRSVEACLCNITELCNLYGGECTVAFLKEQRRRWHPDNFATCPVVGAKAKAEDLFKFFGAVLDTKQQ